MPTVPFQSRYVHSFITLRNTADGVPIFFKIFYIFILTDSRVELAGKMYIHDYVVMNRKQCTQ